MLNNNRVEGKTSGKPLIGITMRYSAAGDFYLRKEYSQAIEECGGVPVHLPLIAKPEYVRALCEILDAVVLPGSDSDVDPLLYNSEPAPQLGKVLRLRDDTDLLLIREAERRAIPVLGICYGMQILNVARGGTLIQDIGSQLPGALGHQQGEPRERLSHYVYFEEKSSLQTFQEDRKVLVNSHHHQAVKTLGRNLTVTARASDGVIEAFEDMSAAAYFVGVQWHPELNWETDHFAKHIFEVFVRAAAETNFKKIEKEQLREQK